MSYEEPEYSIVKKTEVYKVRKYKKRTVAEITCSEDANRFRLLFGYISGANKGSKELKMTIPVAHSKKLIWLCQSLNHWLMAKWVWGSSWPKKYSKQNAPEPIDERIRIIDLPVEYFAVISYPGFASNCIFERHHTELKTALNTDSLVIKGSLIKPSYNSPITLPFL